MIVPIFNNSENTVPTYANSTDAGADLRADFSRVCPENPIKVYGNGEIIFKGEGHDRTLLKLEPGTRALIPTGIYVAIPEGYEIQVRPRSGLALKEGLTVLNTPGTVDAGYRNEIGVILINLSQETRWIEDGERIAQLVLNKFEKIEWQETSLFELMSIGEDRNGGFGSTKNN